VWNFFIFHRRFTAIIIVAAILLGLFSIFIIPKESNPEVDVPFGIVTTVFLGASAEDVEELVTDVLEDKILSLDKIANVTSTSGEGLSIISVEFDAQSDSEKQINELKEKIDEAQIDLPDEAEDPFVQKVRFEDQAIFSVALSGPYQTPQLKTFAEKIKNDLEIITGISRIEIFGGQDREIQVIVDKVTLDSFGLSIAQVTGAIARANADIPTGSIETAGANFNIRLAGRLKDIEDIKKIPVLAIGNTPIVIEDIADVRDSFSEAKTISRLSIEGNDALPAITLSIFKTSGGNIIRIVDQVKEKIEGAKNAYLPENISTKETENVADFIREDLNNLVVNGMQTVIIVMILLFVFVGWRESLLAGFAIPMSFLITFIVLQAIGSTINFLSLFSLILSLGILIDSAIVIVEGMNRYIGEGEHPEQAAVKTLEEFKLPLIAGTLTTVFAFIPMLLMSGILGEFVKHIPITVTIVLLSSLFVALGIITTVGVVWLKRNVNSNDDAMKKRRYVFFNGLLKRYEKTLGNLLLRKSRQRLLLGTVIIAFFASLTLPIAGILEINMFPSENSDFFFIDIKEPIGTPLAITANTIKTIENELKKDDRVESFATTVGAKPPTDESVGGRLQEHRAYILVNLQKERQMRSLVIISEYEQTLPKITEADVQVSQFGSGPPSGAPIEIVLKGTSLEELERVGIVFERILKEIPGTRNVQTSIQESLGEFEFIIDRAKAELFGVNTIELAQILRNAVSGTTATVIRKAGEESEVIVKYKLDPQTQGTKTNVTTIEKLESLTIATRRGDIPLSSFTTNRLTGSRPTIQHKDGKRIIRVTSETQESTNAQAIFQKVGEKLETINIPTGVEVIIGGEREDLTQSYQDMFRAMILAIFLIGSALVLQFNSFRQPFFILITIPLALIGVFFGLVIVNKPLSFPGIIGIVALAGIVVNNAIILISKINSNREEGMEKKEAVMNASTSRLKPILLTTITTVAGILPITLSSELWGPLGFSIIFGLSFSTILTLFVVPMLYVRFGEKHLNSSHMK